MDETALLSHLEALAHALGLQVRYESLEGETAFSSGGLCRIKDKQVIIVNDRVTIGEKIQTLARAMKRFDLSEIYLKPALRDFLEGRAEESDSS